jgi:myo-inositol-1(or 4)-monophosphatase
VTPQGPPDVDALAAVATEAVQAGGAVLADRFGDRVDADYDEHDVKAAADVASEERVLDVLRAERPDDHVYAEESGDHAGASGISWIVDPLDGTNNFTVGLSTFATAAVATDTDGPLAGAVYQPVTDDLYVARRDAGTTVNGDQVATSDGDTVPLGRATVPVVIGHDVKGDAALSAATSDLGAAVDDAVKRIVWSWAPTVYWGLLARGRVDAFVCFHPDREEQVVGEFLAREAGAVARKAGGLTVVADRQALLDELWPVAAGAVDAE